ncbi:MAG TPA: ADP-glyceromanno-heptose 6-epimerase [Chthoniobacterales bacterium]|nr:ADP-glyceromanno-heptose 6-epimerase [Chthoniobacterales bacterium]
MKPTILVTGGAGFIGSALIHALNERGEKKILVTDVDKSVAIMEEEKGRHLRPLHYIDYLSAEALLESLEGDAVILENITTIFHMGACSSTTETNREYLMANNFEYTKRLAQWAIKRGVRFIYASSAATYGDGSQGMQDGIENLQKLEPLNLYGLSKHLFDLYAREQGWFNCIVGLKYFNVFGPNEGHKQEMRSLVSKAYEQIIATGKVRLFKSYRPEYRDGEQQRDFVYVKDAVDMTLYLAENSRAAGLFNIGTGTPRTWIDLATALFRSLDRKPEIRDLSKLAYADEVQGVNGAQNLSVQTSSMVGAPERRSNSLAEVEFLKSSIEFIEMPESIRDQYQYHTCADISLLRSTGYTTPPTSLEDAVSDYVRNYLVPGKQLGE